MDPLLSIWINPKRTFRDLDTLESQKNKRIVNLMFFLLGVTAGLSSAVEIHLEYELSLAIALILVLPVSGLLGVFTFRTVVTFFFWVLARLFEGKASKDEIRLVLAYSFLPYILYLILGLIMLFIAANNGNLDMVSYRNPVTQIVLWTLSIRIMVYGLAYFNKYSYGYAFLNCLIIILIMEVVNYIIKN